MGKVKRISAGMQGVSQAAYVKRCTREECNKTFGEPYPTRDQAMNSWTALTRCPYCTANGLGLTNSPI